MIRAGIAGLGRWGRSLVAAVTGSRDAIRFVRAVTRRRDSAEPFCRDHDIVLVDSYEELVSDPAIDAVVLATPHSLHQAQALAAIAAGKHVFVEKPLTLDLLAAHAVVNAAREAERVLAVGFVRRFHPSIAALRRRLQDGSIGTVIAMVAQHTTSTGQFIAPDNWRASAAEAPAGAFTAVGMHALDHMIEFAGRVHDVRCITGRNYPGPSDDTTTIMLRFEAGATGLIFCSVATATNFEFSAYGTRGLAEIRRPDLSRFRFAPTATAAPTGQVRAEPDEIVHYAGFDMLRAELLAFAGAVRGEAPYPVPLADVLHGMAVFDAVVASAPQGDVVAVAG